MYGKKLEQKSIVYNLSKLKIVNLEKLFEQMSYIHLIDGDEQIFIISLCGQYLLIKGFNHHWCGFLNYDE